MAAPLTLVCAVRLAMKCTGAMVREVWRLEKRVNPKGSCASVMFPPCSNGVGGLVAGTGLSPHDAGVRSHKRSARSRLYLRLHKPVVASGSLGFVGGALQALLPQAVQF